MGAKARGIAYEEELAPTLRAGSVGMNVVIKMSFVLAVDGYNQTTSDVALALRASKSDGDHVGMVLIAENTRSGAFQEKPGGG